MPGEYEHVEEIDDNGSVMCPNCMKTLKAEEDFDYDYIDGEEHDFICPCGAKIRIVVDRPVLKQVMLWKETK